MYDQYKYNKVMAQHLSRFFQKALHYISATAVVFTIKRYELLIVSLILFIYLFIYYHFTALYNMHYYEITIISLSVLSQC